MIPICCSQPSKSLSFRSRGFTNYLEGFRKSSIVALRWEGSLRSRDLVEASGLRETGLCLSSYFLRTMDLHFREIYASSKQGKGGTFDMCLGWIRECFLLQIDFLK